VGTTVDVVTPEGDVATVEAAVTDEGVAAVEGSTVEGSTVEGSTVEGSTVEGSTVEGSGESAQPDGGDVSGAATAPEDLDTPGIETGPGTAGADTATDEGGTPVAAAAPAGAPVDGYDDWSVAQLRGRLRGYQLATVADLVAYEESTRAREPYLRMLRNRLEKVEQQAVESSPLAPRGL
jgi:hypothetical protein